jgi:hypothetical protein
VAAGAPPSFPVNGILDNFNRANEGPPPSASWSGPLFPTNGGLTVASNECKANGDPSSGYLNTTYGPDCEVYCTASVNFAIAGIEICLRISNPNASSITGYLLRCRPWQATEFTIYRIDDSTTLTSLATFDQAMSVGDSLGLKMVGSTLTAYFKPSAGSWTSLGTANDSTFTGAGKLGIRILDDANATVDDFGGGTI